MAYINDGDFFRFNGATFFNHHLLTIQLTTLTGTALYEGSGDSDHHIQTAVLERGLYLVRIIDGEKVNQVRVLKD